MSLHHIRYTEILYEQIKNMQINIIDYVPKWICIACCVCSHQFCVYCLFIWWNHDKSIYGTTKSLSETCCLEVSCEYMRGVFFRNIQVQGPQVCLAYIKSPQSIYCILLPLFIIIIASIASSIAKVVTIHKWAFKTQKKLIIFTCKP